MEERKRRDGRPQCDEIEILHHADHLERAAAARIGEGFAERVLPSQIFHCRFVQDYSGRVRRELFGKSPPLNDRDPESADEILVRRILDEVERLVALAVSREAVLEAPVWGHAGGNRSADDLWMYFEPLFEHIDLVSETIALFGDDHDPISLKTQIRAPDIIHLSLHKNGAGDQSDRDRKLEQHQNVSQRPMPGTDAGRRFERMQ